MIKVAKKLQNSFKMESFVICKASESQDLVKSIIIELAELWLKDSIQQKSSQVI